MHVLFYLSHEKIIATMTEIYFKESQNGKLILKLLDLFIQSCMTVTVMF